MKQNTQITQSTAAFTVSNYKPGDEKEVLKLFKVVFSAERSESHWQWKFKNNPYHAPLMGNVWGSNGELVGHYGTIPTPMLCDGRRVLAIQSVDTMLSPDYRGAGAFQAMGESCYGQATEDNVVAVYGFPNKAAMPGRIKRLGWKQIAPMKSWLLRLKLPKGGWFINAAYRSLLKTLLAILGAWTKLLLPGLRFEASTEVPNQADYLWKSCSAKWKISVWKDKEYLSWRYTKNPERQYTFYSLHLQKELKALAVIWWSKDSGQIAEIFTENDSAILGLYLVNRISREGIKRDVSWINFRGHDQGFFRKAFSGYRERESTEDILCGRVLEVSLNSDFTDPSLWRVTAGDSDGI